MLRFVAAAFALLSVLSAPLCAQAQDWPTKPVRFVVPFPPGGSVDPLARLLATKLGDALKQQFIVENKPGAGGSIGTALVAKGAPDGYSWVVVFDTHGVNQALIPNLPYDTQKDLVPVMLVGTAPMGIVTNPSKPYKTYADIVAAAKGKADAITYGTVGNGSLGHLAMILAGQASGVKFVHVPYKGGGPMMADAIGGQIEVGIASVAALAPNVRGGKLRAIATTGDKRTHTMPDVPTLQEQGLKGFSALAWWGILGTAGTPKPIVDKLHAELVKALNQPDVRKTLTETLGMDLRVSTQDELAQFVAGEMARWGKVVRENGVKPD